MKSPAAFGRLCVETVSSWALNFRLSQPPSGGCVLKQFLTNYKLLIIKPAAFGRLCVETESCLVFCNHNRQPPSGGCVLKHARNQVGKMVNSSRLRAAVC